MSDLLIVCTGDVARSPLLAAILRRELARHSATNALAVGSCGVNASHGHRAAAMSCDVAADWGLSLEDHRSRPLTTELLAETGLVLAMERRHLEAVGRLDVGALARSFRVREFVGLLRGAGVDGPADRAIGDTDPRARLATLARTADQRRSRTRLPEELDIPDPLTAGPAAFTAIRDEFEAIAATVSELIRPAEGP